MPVLKLKISHLLPACAIAGLLALTLPYPGLPPRSLPLEQVVQDFVQGLK
jgi:hypothetical protein